MITLRVRGDKGSRLYQFDQTEIRIGFRSGLEISFPPPEETADDSMRLIRDPDDGYAAEVIGDSNLFFLGGAPLSDRVPIKEGDVIDFDPYSVKIESISQSGNGSDAEGADDDTSGDAVPSPDAGKLRERESFLLMFLEPVREYLLDDDCSEIMINGPNQIYVEQKGKLVLTDAKFLNEAALEAAMRNIARHVGRTFNEVQPRLDARLPDGSRVHAVKPPLARRGTVVAIRKFASDMLTIEKLIGFGSISENGAKLIGLIVGLHKNVIISGPTSSGKTSVLNVLSSFIDDTERILVIEDASELQLQQEHAVQFETRKPDEHGKGEVSIRDLVHSSLRLRPDRLVIGEIRGGESLDMLQAMNTGHSGSMSTIHANSPKDALTRIETCALLSGIDIPLSALREQVASAINCVVHTARLSDGSRKMTHVTEVLPLEDGKYQTQDLLIFHVDEIGPDGKLIGRHIGTGAVPTFLEDAKMRGMEVDDTWFEDGRLQKP